MASMDSKRLCTQDAATVRMLDETLKYKPITFASKPEAALFSFYFSASHLSM
jgi:hypothetical protein